MEKNTLLIVGALGLGMMYMLNQRNQQQAYAPGSYVVPQPGYGQQLPAGYAYNTKTGKVERIVDAVKAGAEIVQVGKSIWDSLFGGNKNGTSVMPNFMPSGNWV